MKKYAFSVSALLLCATAFANGDQVLIQSGAFKNQQFADQQAAKVSLLGVPSTVVEVTDTEGNVVRVVRSKNRMPQKEAEEVIERLEKNDVRAILLSSD